MSELNDELNLKMLERAAEQYESARGAFQRDLKIGVALLLAFLCFVFIPFGRLSKERLRVDAQLTRTMTNYAALTNIHTRVAALSDDLSESASNILVQVRGMPRQLRASIIALEKEVVEFRSQTQTLASAEAETSVLQRAPPRLQSEFANAAFRSREDSLPPLRSRFRSLTREDLKTLHDAPSNATPFLAIVDRLVDRTVIETAFEDLNEEWRTELAQPFAESHAALLLHSNDLARIQQGGLMSTGLVATLAHVEKQLLAYRFSPPSSPTWWTTFVGKEGHAESMSLDAGRAAGSLQQNLKSAEQQLRNSEEKVTALLDQTEALRQSTETELARVHATAASLQKTFERYGAPLPYVELQPRELALYFPALVVFAYAFFAARQMLLRRRAAELTTAYRTLGVSEKVRAMMFSDTASPRHRFGPAVMWITTAVIAGVTAWHLRANEALQPDLPRQIFLWAGLVLLAACVIELYYLGRDPGSKGDKCAES